MLDLIAGGVVLLAAARGARVGFAWQAAALLSLAGGAAVAIPLSETWAAFFGAPSPLRRLIAGSVLFVLVGLAVHLGALLYRRSLERWGFLPWDRYLGAILGAAQGTALTIILILGAAACIPSLRSPIQKTHSGQLAARAVEALEPACPVELRDVLRPFPPPDAGGKPAERGRESMLPCL
ncbi:MAG TPA: CvpA family protein [Planctomycetota bacterium]|nr:CvpA family protein [Planctomycetota bacterium]